MELQDAIKMNEAMKLLDRHARHLTKAMDFGVEVRNCISKHNDMILNKGLKELEKQYNKQDIQLANFEKLEFLIQNNQVDESKIPILNEIAGKIIEIIKTGIQLF